MKDINNKSGDIFDYCVIIQNLLPLKLEKPEDAKKLMQGLVRKYPNYAEAHAALAAVLWSEGEVSKAEGQFSEATRREPLYRDIR